MIYGQYALLIIVSYLLGAIPFGLVVGRMTKGIDVRNYGSGKIGATNTLRSLGPKYAAIVFISDIGKASVSVLLAQNLTGSAPLAVLCGLAAIIGHNWSVYIGWQGGRGVASSCGGLLVLCPQATLIGLVTSIIIMATTRYVSLGSIMGAAVGALTTFFWVVYFDAPPAYGLYAFMAATLIIWQHRDNIRRLQQGVERKLGEKAEIVKA